MKSHLECDTPSTRAREERAVNKRSHNTEDFYRHHLAIFSTQELHSPWAESQCQYVLSLFALENGRRVSELC